MNTLRGMCLCGAVEYRVEDAFSAAFYCHCSKCRRTTGSAFKPMASIPSGKLALSRGEDTLLVFGDPNETHDIHCRFCGSFLYSIIDNGNTHVALGSLVDAPSARPSFHMFVGSKAPWYDITDDLPQYDEFPT
ncbi:GFA family protein [Pelagibacterium limicola]|uniref:GFA family protein n=1 Tax=Pelagibacterium limicola TaxID=2791022 RepID=UPI0018AF7F66|nr:GFA family protein [Pelagibacterium limicola]